MITKGQKITIEQVGNGFVVQPAPNTGYRSNEVYGVMVNGSDTLIFANGRSLRKFLTTHFEEQPGATLTRNLTGVA